MYIMYLGLTTSTSRAEKGEREARKLWTAIKSKLQSTTNYPVVQLSEVTTCVRRYTGRTTNDFGSARASLQNEWLFISFPLPQCCFG